MKKVYAVVLLTIIISLSMAHFVYASGNTMETVEVKVIDLIPNSTGNNNVSDNVKVKIIILV